MTNYAQAYEAALAGKPIEVQVRCWPLCLPEDHRDTPDTRRKNWVRTHCCRCGAFVGYRTLEAKQQPTVEGVKS